MLNSSYLQKVKVLSNSYKDSLKEKEIYTSVQFPKYLNSVAASLLGRNSLSTTLESAGANGYTAYTNGSEIHINWQNGLFSRYVLPETRFAATMGAFFHELSHCIYTDFDLVVSAENHLKKGRFFGDPPKTHSDDEEKRLTRLTAAMKVEKFQPLFLELYSSIHNCIIDKHDEDCIMADYGNITSEAIEKIRGSLFDHQRPYDDVAELYELGLMSFLDIFMDILLQYSRFEDVLMYDKSYWENSAPLIALKGCKDNILAACRSNDLRYQYSQINSIVFAIWEHIEAELENMQKQSQQGQGESSDENGNGDGDGDGNGSDGSSKSGNESGEQGQGGVSSSDNQSSSDKSGSSDSSGDSEADKGANNSGSSGRKSSDGSEKSSGNSGSNALNSSPEQIQSIQDKIKNAAKGKTTGAQPTGRESSETAVASRVNERKQNRNEQGQSSKSDNAPGENEKSKQAKSEDAQKQSSQALENALNSLKEKIAADKATSEVEKGLKNELENDLEILNKGNKYNVPLTVVRPLTLSPATIATAKEVEAAIKPYSKRLQRNISDALRDIKEGGITKRRPYGRMFIPNDAYRPDEKFYAKKNLPQDLPDMAIAVLIDGSGSMSVNNKLATSQRAAILLYDFATGLDIPVFVAGHSYMSQSIGTRYTVCADFNRVSKNDEYRIASLMCNGCNHDGHAITVTADKLLQRTEDVKMLFIISDGLPNAANYGGSKAIKDIQSLVQKYKRRGIEIIAAAIDGDKLVIQSIYGDSFLDISNLDALPKTLTKIVKKRIMDSV